MTATDAATPSAAGGDALENRILATLAVLAPLLLLILVFAHTVALRHLLTLLLLGAVALHAWRSGHLESALRIPMLVWLAFTLLSCAWSVAPALSTNAWLDEAFYPMLLFCAFFVLGRQRLAQDRVPLAVWLGIIALGVMSLAGYAAIAPDVPRRGFLYFYPGVGQASSYALFAVPVLLLMLHRTTRWRWFAASGLAASALVGSISLNRMYWPAVAVTALIAIVPLLRAHSKRAAIAVIVGAAAFLAAFVFVLTARGLPVPDKPESSLVDRVAAQLSKDTRPALWRAWYQRGLEHPWLGIGFGKNIPRLYHRPRNPDDPMLADITTGTHAHNLLLNVFLQLGLIGLALFLWLLASLSAEFVKRAPYNPSVAWAGIALIVAMLIKNSTDDFMRDSMAMYFWALAGWLLARAQLDAGSRMTPRSA